MTLNEWKQLEITQVVTAELIKRKEWIKDQLLEQAGKDPLEDRWKAGVAAGYQDFLDIELGEETLN